MINRLEKRGYQLLADSGRVPKEQLDRVLKESESAQESFSQLLVREGLIEEVEILELYAKEFGHPFVSLKKIKISAAAVQKVPVKFAWYYRFFPYSQEGGKLQIAVSRPVDVNFIDEVRFGLGLEVEVAFARDQEIEEMLQKHYGVASDTLDKILTQSGPKTQAPPQSQGVFGSDVEDLEKLAENASVIQLVNQILLDAYRKGASDIHLEPFRGKVRLRYRIDGVLHEAPMPAELNQFFTAMISRIKIMANLNIVEKRLPQDGKARVKTQDQSLDLRVSSIPTPHGESLVIRILPGQRIRSLSDLGLEPEQRELFQKMLEAPHGIIFVTGPTGSGKSTTLYAGLSSINKENHKIITIEDPVEYELDGITQIQVQPQVGLTFAMGLRSVLRHDPDVMMVGEVRDLETADIAIRVALTGHLILSTLHTNDAASGVTRLLDIGIEPYLVSSSVNAFIAQRLIRVICPGCKEEDTEVIEEIRAMVRRELSLSPSDPCPFYRGRGCDRCHGTGYAGRVALYEFLPVTEAIRKLIFQRASAEAIKQHAQEQGMKTLRQNGWGKVLQGVTTFDEILQVSPNDDQEKPVLSPPQGLLPEMPQRSAGQEKHISERFNEEDPLEFVNRRAYARVKVQLQIRYREIDLERDDLKEDPGQGAYTEAYSDDISANGLCFTLPAEISPGTALDLRIRLPGEKTEIQCISRVVRILKTLDTMRPAGKFLYQLGATFLAINSTDRRRLENFCTDRSKT